MNKKITGVAIFTIAILAMGVFAFQGAGRFQIDEETLAQMEETRTNIEEAIENADFETWKNLVEETPMGDKMLEKITEDNFPTLVELHNKMKEVKELREELGIEMPMGKMGKGMKNGFHRGKMNPFE
jgi:hypothetical protein